MALSREKQEELDVSRRGWENSLSKLASEMSQLRELHSIALAEKTQELGSVEAAHQSEIERLQMEFESKLREVGKNKAQNERTWRTKIREVEDQMTRERRAELEKLESNSHQERMQMMESQRIAVSGLNNFYQFFFFE